MKFPLVCLAALILTAQASNGQATDTTKTRVTALDRFLVDYMDRGLSLAVVLQPNIYGDIGLSFGEYGSLGICSGASRLFTIGSEFGWSNEDGKFIIGPKLSFEWGVILAGRLNVAYYTDFEKGDLRFTPEIGLSFISFGVYYGYSFNLTKDKLDIAHDKVSVRLNIDLDKN